MVSVPSMTRLVWLALAAGWIGFLYYLSSQSVIGVDAIDSGSDSALALRKLAHFLAFGLLALLLRWGLGPMGSRPSISLAAFAITLAYAVGDEYHQSLVSGRYGAVSPSSKGCPEPSSTWSQSRTCGSRPRTRERAGAKQAW